MKARLVRNGSTASLLCTNGTIMNATPALMTRFLLQFHEASLFSGEGDRWTDSCFDMSEYPGETLAYVTDTNQLVMHSPWVIETVLETNLTTPKELTLMEYAEKHNRSKEMIKTLIRAGRIPGAIRRGRQWFIPENTPYPIDVRSRKPEAGRTRIRTEEKE